MIVHPPRAVRALRHERLTAAIPAAVLLLGMAAVAWVVTSTPRLSADELFQLARGGYGISPVDDKLAGWWRDVQYNPFNPAIAHRPLGLTLALATPYYLAVAAIGAPVVAALRGNDRWPSWVSAIAGFLPGYLIVLVPLQLLFAVIPVRTAAWVALVAVPAAAMVLYRKAIADAWTARAPVAQAQIGRASWR